MFLALEWFSVVITGFRSISLTEHIPLNLERLVKSSNHATVACCLSSYAIQESNIQSLLCSLLNNNKSSFVCDVFSSCTGLAECFKITTTIYTSAKTCRPHRVQRAINRSTDLTLVSLRPLIWPNKATSQDDSI